MSIHSAPDHDADFTEGEYEALLSLVRSHWPLLSLPEALSASRGCVWRHDVDFSPQRALAVARIEARQGVKATYFLLMQGSFYNPFEPTAADAFREILDLGHDIGVHFDPMTYLARGFDLNDALALERDTLSGFFRTRISAFSYHNTDVCRFVMRAEDLVAGLVNAYGRTLQKDFSYLSDSNGYWRYRRLRDVLEAADESRLHILTHPVWWTPEPMRPAARVARAIDGRARHQLEEYHAQMAARGPAIGG